ncbi:hypothetical protein [Cyanobacterium sp. Dongsha4]|nr:hypothetical protein [Cyanobacterium sp. Dongsha4]WVL02550.1 hypothetical protein Dongsha4_18910 [Cyanobacterium sp. Dongsha4]
MSTIICDRNLSGKSLLSAIAVDAEDLFSAFREAVRKQQKVKQAMYARCG